VNKPTKKRFPWGAISQPFAGIAASSSILLYGLVIWVSLNGMEKAGAFIDADPSYALLLLDHMNYWLITGTIAIVILSFKKHRFRIGASVMAAILVLATAGNLYVHTRINDQILPTASKTVPNIALDPKLTSLATETGINADNLKRAHAQVAIPPNLDSHNPCLTAIGCFDNNVIASLPSAASTTTSSTSIPMPSGKTVRTSAVRSPTSTSTGHGRSRHHPSADTSHPT
jgi:hypothetical protein